MVLPFLGHCSRHVYLLARICSQFHNPFEEQKNDKNGIAFRHDGVCFLKGIYVYESATEKKELELSALLKPFN